MSFKRDGADPGFDRVSTLPGLPGGPAWAATVERAAGAVQEFVNTAMGLTKAPDQPEDHIRYRRSRRRRQRPKKRPNRLIISKRVRRKHRRARKCR